MKKTTPFINVFLLASLLFLAGATTALAVPEDQLPNGSWGSIAVWDHTNVSGWAKTTTMSSVSISGGMLVFPWDQASSWPGMNIAGGTDLVGNVWAIININGRWVASTFDFLRRGQISKKDTAISHDAIPSAPGWHPQNGEELYIFVSGQARYPGQVNIAARSNVVRYYWNAGTGTPPPECTGPPVIEYFTGPAMIRKGEKALLKWKITGASGVSLTGSDGFYKEIPTGPVVEGSGYLSPSARTTYTLKATNSCVEGADPQKQLTVTVGGGITGATLLLLNSRKK